MNAWNAADSATFIESDPKVEGGSQFPNSAGQDAVPALRTVNLTRASDIEIKPVHWLWADRIALGTLTLLGGREGIGKTHGGLPARGRPDQGATAREGLRKSASGDRGCDRGLVGAHHRAAADGRRRRP